jgi:cytochrome c oxidase subunit IV
MSGGASMASVETTEHEHKGTPVEPHHQSHEHAHPSDRDYYVVAVILGVLTAIEVSTYFFNNLSTTVLVVWLFPLMIFKFGIVCGWFMHLRYDNPLFRRVFVFGLTLAVIVYCVMLTVMNFWSSSYGS